MNVNFLNEKNVLIVKISKYVILFLNIIKLENYHEVESKNSNQFFDCGKPLIDFYNCSIIVIPKPQLIFHF